MFEKVELMVQWIAGDSYSVSKTFDSRTIVIQRNFPPPHAPPPLAPPAASFSLSSSSAARSAASSAAEIVRTAAPHESAIAPRLPSLRGFGDDQRPSKPPLPPPALSSVAAETRSAALKPSLNPETPEFQPSSRSSSRASAGPKGSQVDENNNIDNDGDNNGAFVADGAKFGRVEGNNNNNNKGAIIKDDIDVHDSTSDENRRSITSDPPFPAASADGRHGTRSTTELPPYRIGQKVTVHPCWIEDALAKTGGKSRSL